MSKTKKKRSKAYNIMKTVKEQNIIQRKRTKTKKKVKDVKMDRVQQHKQKRSKTVKIKKNSRPP